MSYKILIIMAFTLLSCSKTDFTKDECEILSMKKYKGYHRESNQFDNYCKQFDLHYTQNRCKKALKQLILGSNLETIQNTHGKEISECFTKNDLKKFGPRE